MQAVLEDAEGLQDIWLIEYAGEAEACRIRLEGLQNWAR